MVLVRAADEHDLPAILAIYNDAIANTTAIFHYQPHTLEMRREWFDQKRIAGQPIFVAIIGGDVVGFATYGPFRPWPAYKYTIEHSVYTAANARRRGVARGLVRAVLDHAQQCEYHAVIAGIVADNDASLRLHESLGFVEVAHFREVGFKFGRWLDLKFLQLILPTPRHPSDS